MADLSESKVFLNDPAFITPIPMEESLSENLLTDPLSTETEPETLTPAQEMMIDQLLSESNDNLEGENENQKEISNIVNENSKEEYTPPTEEHHVESPTTRESFTFKCIFCDRVLSAADNPKLLECLHNSCSSCIDSRLYEHSNDGIPGE